VEAVVLQDPWSSLFTDAELETARSRLGQSGYFDHAPEPSPTPPSSTPDELIEPQSFPEGTREQITVNAYERDPKARDLCIQHFGVSCYVCEFDFEESYGELGRNFIHVHHLTPFSTASGERTTDPRMDLRPVCPNCHAMLHRTTPPMPIGELKRLLADRRRSKA
jgi:5-methylcytosine-specific restriction protein A